MADDGSFSPPNAAPGADSLIDILKNCADDANGNSLTDTATVTITLNVLPPLSQPCSYATDVGVELTVDASNGLLANDTNKPGSFGISISVAIDTDATQALFLADDGSYLHTKCSSHGVRQLYLYSNQNRCR